jgi:hypothetical protein
MIGKIVSGASSGRKCPHPGTKPSADDGIAAFKPLGDVHGMEGIVLSPQDQRRESPRRHRAIELLEAEAVERAGEPEQPPTGDGGDHGAR